MVVVVMDRGGELLRQSGWGGGGRSGKERGGSISGGRRGEMLHWPLSLAITRRSPSPPPTPKDPPAAPFSFTYSAVS